MTERRRFHIYDVDRVRTDNVLFRIYLHSGDFFSIYRFRIVKF